MKSPNGRWVTRCECRCDCGNICIKRLSNLIGHETESTSCGCIKPVSKNRKDYVGQRFGRLVINEMLYGGKRTRCRCLCDCGGVVYADLQNVTSGTTSSCGCLWLEKKRKSDKLDYSNLISSTGVKILHPTEIKQGSAYLWRCLCPACGSLFDAVPCKVLANRIQSCGCAKTSGPERFIEKTLVDMNISFVPQKRFEDCRDQLPLPFDFAIYDGGKLRFIIEYDGEQHYSPVSIFGGQKQLDYIQKHDSIKNEYCRAFNIPLLRLTHNDSFKDIKTKIQQMLEQTSI